MNSFFSKPYLFLYGCLLMGSLLLLSIVLQYPTIHLINGWLWQMRTASLDWSILILTGLAIAVLTRSFFQQQAQPKYSIAILIIVGFLSQWGLALSSGEGSYSVQYHAVHSGHSEFAQTASRHLDDKRYEMLQPVSGNQGLKSSLIIQHYEELMALPNQHFSQTKPPGQLLVYLWIAKLSVYIIPPENHQHNPIPRIIDIPHRQTVDLLTILLPLFAALTAWPFVLLSRQFTAQDHWIPVLLFLLGPSFSLVIMHLDQALYPLMSCAMWVCSIYACITSKRWFWGIATGVFAWLCCFISFSLLPAVAITPLIAFACCRSKNRLIPAMLYGIASFLICWLIWGILWDYDPIHRFQQAMSFHHQWKAPLWKNTTIGHAAMLNSLEFLWWIGPPTSILLCVGIGQSILKIRQSKCESIDILSLGFVIVLATILLFGKTMGEVARLWIFLMPLAFLIASVQLQRYNLKRKGFLAIWIGWQLMWTIAIKYGQDFF